MNRFLSLLTLCVGLSACAADSRSDLANEVEELAKAGMPVTQAEAMLQRAGFQCAQEPGDGQIVRCNRERSHRLLATCIHNVYLIGSEVGNRVEKLDVPNPSCTGL